MEVIGGYSTCGVIWGYEGFKVQDFPKMGEGLGMFPQQRTENQMRKNMETKWKQ